MDQELAYLVLVRLTECIVPGCECGVAGGEAHHVYTGGGGMKCSHFDTVGICSYHHTQGPNAVDKIGWSRNNEAGDDWWWENTAKMTREEGIALTRKRVLVIVEQQKRIKEFHDGR